MSKSVKKVRKGTRKKYDDSIEGISRTGKRCKNGYLFDKETQLCRGKLKISVFDNLGDLQISETGNTMSFEPANDKQTIMKVYKEGGLVHQTVMSEKDIRQSTKRGNKKMSKMIKHIERIKNNPKLLQDPKIKKMIQASKKRGGGDEDSPKEPDAEIHIPASILPVIETETSKTERLKTKIIELQKEMDKIDKFQNSTLANDYYTAFSQNFNWWSAGLFGLVLGSTGLLGIGSGIGGGMVGLFLFPIFGCIALLMLTFFATSFLWISNGMLEALGLNFIEYYLNYINVYIMATYNTVLFGQYEMSVAQIQACTDHFELLEKYNYSRDDMNSAYTKLNIELEDAKKDLAKEMASH